MSKEISKTKKVELAPIQDGVAKFGGMVNAEQEDFSLDRLALIQGTSMETEMYGDHKRGTWVFSFNAHPPIGCGDIYGCVLEEVLASRCYHYFLGRCGTYDFRG